VREHYVAYVDTSADPATVLVIEDEADLREAACEFLRILGFEACAAANGVAALEAIRRLGPPALILLDLTMPVMNGYEFLKRLRENDSLEQVPVVVTSAIDELPEGASYLLRKPYEMYRLVEVLNRCCSRQDEYQASASM
jgi:CheY-like chemotaxis protein